MKLIDKYYYKVYKQTEKVVKKLFSNDVSGIMAVRFGIKKEIEGLIKKPIEEISREDIIKYNLGYKYTKYKTISRILQILEDACVLKSFTIQELESGR